MIRVEHLCKRWPAGRDALVDISFQAAPGTLTALIGPSGSGKTTLLRVIAGLESADGGEVVNPYGQPGMVFQEPSLWPHLTLLENVSLPLHVVKLQATADATERATAVL